MQIILATHMNAIGRSELYTNGFKSSDTMPGPVDAALKQVGIEWRNPFACVAVYHADENPYDQWLPAWAWGPPVILKPEVLNKLEVACASDIQNAASGGDAQRIKRMFRNLLTAQDKERVLLELLTLRPTNTWTEARMFSLLRDEDVAEDRYRTSLDISLLDSR